jgi:hypothetical protein
MSADVNVGSEWDFIEQVLPENYKTLAVEMHLIRQNLPKHLGAKVTDATTLLRLVLHHAGTGASLKSTAGRAAAIDVVDISGVALHKWMKKSGPYLACLLVEMLGTREAFDPERLGGYAVRAIDATSLSRPGASGTTARIHYVLGLPELELVQVDVTDETGGETFRRFNAGPGELWIGDRAYANPPGIGAIHRAGADVLVRYNRGSLPLYRADGRLLDVASLLGELRRRNEPREWDAWVHAPEGQRIRGRLCAIWLPVDKAQEARERARREHGSNVDAATLTAAEYVVLFTTAPSKRLPLNLVLDLYRARWQVELHIKRGKSLGDIDELQNRRDDTIHSWLCANLLLQEIARRVAATGAAFSPSSVLLGRPDGSRRCEA